MNTLVVFATILAVALAIPTDTYDAKYDSFDADALVGNERLLLSYLKCFLDEAPCTAEGADFKKTMPEALHTKCAKCSPKQKEIVRKVCRAFIAQFPDKWDQLAKKQDPSGEYKEFLHDFLNSSD